MSQPTECRGCMYLEEEGKRCKRPSCPYFQERLEFFRRRKRKTPPW